MTAATVDIDAGSVLADLGTVLRALRAVGERLAPDRMWSCSGAEVTQILRTGQEISSVLAAIDHSAIREADARGLAADAGQSSTAVWLAHLLRLNPDETATRVKDADTMCRTSPSLGDALAAGAVNDEQARAIAAGLRKIEKVASAAEYTGAEDRLIAEAKVHNARDLRKLGEYIVTVLDPDGAPERDERARQARSLALIDLGNGQHRIRGIVTDEVAAILNAALDPLAAPRPEADGRKDPRSATQRRVDALGELASRFLRLGDLPQARGERPHVSIIATAHTLQGDAGHPFARSASGEDISQETLRKICCDAGLTPIVVNTLGKPLSIGRSSRVWPTPIWVALVARDVGCVFAGCTRPASWCDAHHIEHWIDGGETRLDNGALLCGYHHDQVHHHGWQIRLGADGHPELIPPPWVDPLQRPQRNAHWKLAREGLKTDPDRGP